MAVSGQQERASGGCNALEIVRYHFYSILLVKASPDSPEGWGSRLHLLVGRVVKNVWPFIIYHMVKVTYRYITNRPKT